MGFTFDNSTLLKLEIEGEAYEVPLDSPEFIDFWRNNADRLNGLTDDSNPDMAKDVVMFTVDLITALLGADVSKRLFNNKRVSLAYCAGLIVYITGEMAEQGMTEKLAAATAKYGTGSVLR